MGFSGPGRSGSRPRSLYLTGQALCGTQVRGLTSTHIWRNVIYRRIYQPISPHRLVTFSPIVTARKSSWNTILIPGQEHSISFTFRDNKGKSVKNMPPPRLPPPRLPSSHSRRDYIPSPRNRGVTGGYQWHKMA